MTDIPELIERLRDLDRGVGRIHDTKAVREAIDELSRLSAFPLPEEIAGLAAYLLFVAQECWGEISFGKDARERLRKAAAALQQQARENAILKTAIVLHDQQWKEMRGREADLQARIRELEAKRDQQAQEIERLKDHLSRVRSVYDFAKQAARIHELEAEHDEWVKLCTAWREDVKAIRAKTIEECAQIADKRRNVLKSAYGRGFDCAAESIALEIRALQPAAEGGEGS